MLQVDVTRLGGGPFVGDGGFFRTGHPGEFEWCSLEDDA